MAYGMVYGMVYCVVFDKITKLIGLIQVVLDYFGRYSSKKKIIRNTNYSLFIQKINK